MTKKEEECINGKGQTEIEIGDDVGFLMKTLPANLFLILMIELNNNLTYFSLVSLEINSITNLTYYTCYSYPLLWISGQLYHWFY